MQGKHAIFAGLAAGLLFATTLFAADPMQPGELAAPATAPAAAPRPLSAVVVTSCGLAVALYIQLDATHLLRADPRQSDMFTAVDGVQHQGIAGPMKWNDAYTLAQTAVLTSNVQLPCNEEPTT